MDNLTHTLTGLALSRAGLNRFYARPDLLLMIAANIPDIDMLSLLGGPLTALDVHRGWTHSLLMWPVMAAIPALLVMALSRSAKGWAGAYALSLMGVASHLLFDWTNIYGIRLLFPFSPAWLHLDLNAIVDVWIWVVLLLAWIGPMLGRLVSSEIGARPGAGRGLPIFALLFIVVFCCGKILLHQRALAVLNARIYDGAAPAGVAAFPTEANPLAWTGWVETENRAIRYNWSLASEFDPGSGTVFYKPEPSPALEAARQSNCPCRVRGNRHRPSYIGRRQ